MEKDSTTIIGGTSVCNISGKHNLNVVKNINIHTDADADIEASGKMIIASEKNMYIKSKVKVDIAKG